MNNKQVKELLIRKMMERWLEEKPDMMKDIEELTSKVIFFNMKWGTNLQAEDVIIKPNE